MENIKEQIEELRNEFNDRLNKLEQQINNPIEVGDIFKTMLGKIGVITDITGGRVSYYGLHQDKGWCTDDWVSIEMVTKATKEEWTLVLKKHADKIYEGVVKVDRSELDIGSFWNNIRTLNKEGDSYLSIDGEFQYKQVVVMDKHGKWAKAFETQNETFVYLVIDTSNHMINGCFSTEEKA